MRDRIFVIRINSEVDLFSSWLVFVVGVIVALALLVEYNTCDFTVGVVTLEVEGDGSG